MDDSDSSRFPFLYASGQPERAREVLQRIRHHVDAEKEYQAIVDNHQKSRSQARHNSLQILRKVRPLEGAVTNGLRRKPRYHVATKTLGKRHILV